MWLRYLTSGANGGSAESRLSIDLRPSHGARWRECGEEEVLVVSSTVRLRSILRDLKRSAAVPASVDVTNTFQKVAVQIKMCPRLCRIEVRRSSSSKV